MNGQWLLIGDPDGRIPYRADMVNALIEQTIGMWRVGNPAIRKNRLVGQDSHPAEFESLQKLNSRSECGGFGNPPYLQESVGRAGFSS